VIHTNRPAFDRFRVEGLETVHDARHYDPAAEICFRLTHKDVYLGCFENGYVAAAVNGLRAGQPLSFSYDHEGRPQVRLPNGYHFRFSRRFEKKLAAHVKAGYAITAVSVHFIVYWRDAEEHREHKVVLPLVTMGKRGAWVRLPSFLQRGAGGGPPP
jgi:hypothetical protein